ncbi:MAG: hypothetical protein JNM65_13935 [Verrucomicrobiaceae bacterium]|nr:hypothetical protein [Verrucomicrobiaceae bacterium]
MELDALFHRLHNAGPWRGQPEGFGTGARSTVLVPALLRERLWARILARLARKAENRIRLVDGTHVRVHQCSAKPRGGASAQDMGKTRGGRNAKIKVLTDVRGLPV